jgi:hypothetical protein
VSSGGCVLGTDQVLSYNNSQTEVANLNVGDYIYGYDTQTGKMQLLRVTFITTTSSPVIEYINGNIGVTPTDQPMYVKNAYYQGWINNPSSIKIGWYLFNPQTQEWTRVNNVTYDYGNYFVYNIYTNGTNTYVLNGALVDTKVA